MTENNMGEASNKGKVRLLLVLILPIIGFEQLSE